MTAKEFIQNEIDRDSHLKSHIESMNAIQQIEIIGLVERYHEQELKKLRLGDVSSRYSLSYLDEQEFEQKTEVWAKDQDDALKQLEKICPNATYIFIRRL